MTGTLVGSGEAVAQFGDPQPSAGQHRPAQATEQRVDSAVAQHDLVIEVQGLGKVFQTEAGRIQALADVNLQFGRGEMVAVMGPSGSGKSTFMSLLGCLESPSTGRYRLAGEEVSSLRGPRLAEVRNRRVGFVFQQFNLLARASALENVALPLLYAGVKRVERMRRAQHMLEAVGLADRMRHTPAQLSGGQQQRVAIARALINQPSVILADEPTGALDSATSAEVMALLKALHAQGQTIVYVTHDAQVASYAQRVVQFRDGQVVEDRRPALNCA